MALSLAQKFINLGMASPLAVELVRQINVGAFNWKRLMWNGMVPDLAKYVAESLDAGTFDPRIAMEKTMSEAVATLTAGEGYSAEARALFERHDVQLSPAFKRAVSNLTLALVDAGAWDKRDAIYLACLETTQQSLLNIKDATFPLTAVNAPTFVAGKGYTFNGSSSYLDTGYNPVTAGGQFTLNSASLGFSTFQAAATVRAGNNNARIGKTNNSTPAYSRANDASTQDGTAAQLGDFIWSRGASGSYGRTVDGVHLADVVVPSTSMTSANITIGKADTLYGAGGVSTFRIGGHLTADERLAEQAAFRTFLLEIGAAFYTIGATAQTIASRTFNVQSAEETWSIQKAAFRPSLYSFEARQGDFWSGDTGNDRIRAELQCTTKETFDTDVWVSYAVKIAATPSLQSDYLVIGQFHATEDLGDFEGYPAFELNLNSDGLSIYTATVAEASRPTSYGRTLRASGLSFPLDQWNNIVIRVKFNFSGAAELAVYINGEEIVDLSGISIGMNDTVGPYWKHGLYWGPETAEQTIVGLFDNLEIGAADLSARIAIPLATVV